MRTSIAVGRVAGTAVAFEHDGEAYARDLDGSPAQLVSVTRDGRPATPATTVVTSISDDGRFVAFDSSADDLVPGDDNHLPDVFVRDRVAGTTTLADFAGDGTPADHGAHDGLISGDGHVVAFRSASRDLAGGHTQLSSYALDLGTGRLRDAGVVPGATGPEVQAISRDGRFVLLEGGYDETGDTVPGLYRRDLAREVTRRVDLGPKGKPMAGYVGHAADLSANGRVVLFGDSRTGLAGGRGPRDYDVYRRDVHTGRLRAVNLNNHGRAANRGTPGAVLSGDGRWVAFASAATNLAADTNGAGSIYERGSYR